MKRRLLYAVRAFGWQLDYRPDGWLPLGIREDLGVTWSGPKWHVLRLGRFGCVTLGRLASPRTVTVTLTADTTRFVAAMDQVALSLAEMKSVQAYRARIRHERALGLAYVDGLIDDMCRDIGIDRIVVGVGP